MTGVVKSVGKYALLAGTALALSISVASAASMTKAGMDKRVADLEREVTLLKNQMKSAMMAKPDATGMVSGSSTVKVSVYGRVNQMVRFASTPAESAFQALDNTHSGSRFGIRAGGSLNKNTTVGSTIEVGVNGANRAGSDFNTANPPGVGLRIAQVDIGHKDMGTVSLGHGWRAGSGAMTASFAGASHVFGIWGPGGDGLLKGKRHGAVQTAYGTREGRLLYRTPSIMGTSIEASYNQDKGWSAGGTFTGFPSMKDVSIALSAGYHSVGEDAAETSLGVSGGVKHNASGFNINGSWGNQAVKGGATAISWMVDGGWTGKVTDAGNTTINVGYGQWGDGLHGKSTRYHFVVSQDVSAAASKLYLGVSYDTGDYTHTVAHTRGGAVHRLDPSTGEITTLNTADPAEETGSFSDADAKFDQACGTAAFDANEDSDIAGVQNDAKCAVSRDGVFTVIAGVLIVF